MNPLLVKVFALALTLSQVYTRPPEQFKLEFGPADQDVALALLNDGCTYFTKQMDMTPTDLQPLITAYAEAPPASIAAPSSIAPSAPDPVKAASKVPELSFESIMTTLNLGVIKDAFSSFCMGQKLSNPNIQMSEVFAYYNGVFKDLPDINKLKGLHLPEASTILDRHGKRFTEIYADDGRRQNISISDLPPYVVQAFVSAEDQHFFQHNGLDISGIARAFSNSMDGKAHPEGGSTIDQQVLKNALVGDDLTFDRKMREMVLAPRLEQILKKMEILELYLNRIYLGRASWGIGMAAQSYFGKPAKELTPAEAATLASLPKGPNYYSPDKAPDKLAARRKYVLDNMKSDGCLDKKESCLTDDEYKKALQEDVKVVTFESPRRRAAYYFLDEIQREVKRNLKISGLTSGSYTVRSTIDPELQKETEAALQDGLAAWELPRRRALWTGPVGSLADDLTKYKKTWQELLPSAHSKYYDIQWPLATVTAIGGGTVEVTNKKGKKVHVVQGYKVGLADGREFSLKASANILPLLKLYDLVHVNLDEDKQVATLRIPPRVQGASVVLEAKTGRVLAMAGGFSYAASQLNRVTRSARQPGSTLKPFVHLAALQMKLQPDTELLDQRIVYDPIEPGGHFWSPQNYEKEDKGGRTTMRDAVENSLNRPTVYITSKMAQTPQQGLDWVRAVTEDFGMYNNPQRNYPFPLGAQPARLLDMVVAYATIANVSLPATKDCAGEKPVCLVKPAPHFVDSVEQAGQTIWARDEKTNLTPIHSVDRVSLFQMRRILEGTIARGTAKILRKDFNGFVAGKTGTSSKQHDAWFIAFTNDLVVGTWVGYDDDNVAPNLGDGQTGAVVALPITSRIIKKSFDVYAPKVPLADLPPDLQKQVVQEPIDDGFGGYVAYRIEGGRKLSTRDALLPNSDYNMAYDNNPGEEGNPEENDLSAEDMQAAGPDSIQEAPEEGYQPVSMGAEDNYDLWQQRGRQVDPDFTNSFWNQQ
jgi:membrane carboxypeptidase/penicillin-binding protein